MRGNFISPQPFETPTPHFLFSSFCLFRPDSKKKKNISCSNIFEGENVNPELFFSRICQRYEEITDTIECTPESTEELVTLSQYIKKTSDVTVQKLRDDTNDASLRIFFLLDYAILPCMSILYMQIQANN